VLPQVLALERQRLLDEHLVDAAQRGDQPQPVGLRVDRIAALLGEVQRVRGHADDQPVAERAGALEEADVADVQHVEGAEGDDAAQGAVGGAVHQVGR